MDRAKNQVRRAAVLVAILLIGGAFWLQPGTGSYARAMGIETSVQENPYNKAAQQLQQKEQSMNERQRALENLEQELNRSNRNLDLFLILLTVFIFVLFVLILTNYYLDYRRRKQQS